MKRKSQKFRKFIESSNSVNYKDNATIIEHFNNSVRLFKRFQDINAAGDERLAADKMRDAGTYLYQSCEWALKNYLHRRYSGMFNDDQITLLEKTKKIDSLSKKETNLYSLIEEFKNFSDPSYMQSGIRIQDILSNAIGTNNNPKHNATIPDPNQYKKSLGEIRKIIKMYIDRESKLDLIEDTIYGGEKGWYEILEDTSDFSEAFSYVLVVKRTDFINIKGLFSVKWDMVIDLDPSSDIDGLASQYIECTGINPWIRMLNNIDSKRKFSFSRIPYWIMANGNSDNPDTIVDTNRWKNRYGKYLDSMLEEFHKVYTKPVKVFLYPIENEKNVERIIEAFDDIFEEGDDVDFCVLSPDYEYSRIDGFNFKKSTLSILDFCNNLLIYHEGEIFTSGLLKKQLPDSSGNYVIINDAFYAELMDSFEVIYIDIDKEEENNALKTSRSKFYHGDCAISWYGIKENFDVTRKDKDKIIEKISLDMSERGRLLKRVCYEPGVGGTTLLRRIAWEFREKYPTLILEKYNEQTAKNIQKLYDITHSPVLIFADNNIVGIEEVQNLQIELKRMGFAFVICYFERKLKGLSSSEGAIYTVVQSLVKTEAREMQLKLNDFIDDAKVKEKLEQIISESNTDERTPFIMSMYAFDKDFKGVKPYIANFLTHMNEQTKKIIFALALADYGNVAMDVQYFTDLYNDDSVANFLIDETPGINELVRLDNISGKENIRIKYHLFAEEVLRQMSLGRNAEDISFMNLLDNILVFIEDSRKNRYIINQDTLNVLRSLFITRIADVDSEKPAFSPLITRLREEHRVSLTGAYDASNDAIIRIFNKLVEVYPEEPHFTAHLARYYFYIDKNFEKGFSNIDAAIDLSETMNGIVDPLLYHMKAMGYSSRITNYFIRNIMKNERQGTQEENLELISKIEEDAYNAFKYFEIVRDNNIGVAGHVSEINLCIQITNMVKNLSEESEDFYNYLSSEKGNWAMKYVDRATDLWDECKKLALETNFENLDDIEIKLNQLTASLEDSIQLWEEYIRKSEGKNRIQARRLLARAYEKQINKKLNLSLEQDNLNKIIQLMEDNMVEESQQSGNIRIWFDAIMKLKVDNQDALIMDAIVKLNRWISLTDSVEAHYYRFVLKFIQAIEGSSLAEAELPKLLRELKSRSLSLYNRTAPQHWLTNEGIGLSALMSNSRSKKDAIPEDEMVRNLGLLVGRISNNYVNESHAYINFRGVEVYFNPSATKGEIDMTKINQRVKFGIGFSYDGPRAYNSSIKVLGKDDFIEDRKRIESGIVVKCEVIKNKTYYTQVRIVGYEELGSIYIKELLAPYTENSRPPIGTVLEGKVLNQKFDNKTQRNMWMITMDIRSGIVEPGVEETVFSKALRGLNLTR